MVQKSMHKQYLFSTIFYQVNCMILVVNTFVCKSYTPKYKNKNLLVNIHKQYTGLLCHIHCIPNTAQVSTIAGMSEHITSIYYLGNTHSEIPAIINLCSFMQSRYIGILLYRLNNARKHLATGSPEPRSIEQNRVVQHAPC